MHKTYFIKQNKSYFLKHLFILKESDRGRKLIHSANATKARAELIWTREPKVSSRSPTLAQGPEDLNYPSLLPRPWVGSSIKSGATGIKPTHTWDTITKGRGLAKKTLSFTLHTRWVCYLTVLEIKPPKRKIFVVSNICREENCSLQRHTIWRQNIFSVLEMSWNSQNHTKKWWLTVSFTFGKT